jgi:hypothetical protein
MSRELEEQDMYPGEQTSTKRVMLCDPKPGGGWHFWEVCYNVLSGMFARGCAFRPVLVVASGIL